MLGLSSEAHVHSHSVFWWCVSKWKPTYSSTQWNRWRYTYPDSLWEITAWVCHLNTCVIWRTETELDLQGGKKISKAAPHLGCKFHNKGINVNSGLTFIASSEPEWDRLLGHCLLNERCLGGVCRTHYFLVLTLLWFWCLSMWVQNMWYTLSGSLL